MTRHRRLLLGGVLFALAAGWALLESRGPVRVDKVPYAAGGTAPSSAAALGSTPAPQVDHTVAQPGAKVRPSEESPAAAPTAPTFPPLPDVDQPFPQIRAQLESQARAGDAAAAFRLYGELTRCQGYSRSRFPVDDEDDPARRVWRQERNCVLQHLCGDDPKRYADPDGQRWDWLAQAAVAGHPLARLNFTEGRMLRDHPQAALRHRDLFRQHAVAWTLDLARRGQQSALNRLAMAYADDDGYGETPLGQLLPHDRVRAGMYAWLGAQRSPRPSSDPMALLRFMSGGPLSSAERQAALTAAQRWQAQFPPDPSLPAYTGDLSVDLRQLPTLAARCTAIPEPAPETPTP